MQPFTALTGVAVPHRNIVSLCRWHHERFGTSSEDRTALLSSVFLLNGMGVDSGLNWNGPSWSISAEVWTYFLFGAAVLLLRGRLWMALLPAIIVGPVILYLYSPHYMDATFDFGFVRCVYGFALGALLHDLSRKRLAAAVQPQGRSAILWTIA